MSQARRIAVDVLAFEFEMGLFPAVLEEAKGKGIDLTPKYIPAEVFDKRAVEKGQVVFHDISFVEATPRYDKKNKLRVRIELTDFSVYYTQGAAEAAIAALKNGKSEVVCEQGQLYKISKDKNGVVTKEAHQALDRLGGLLGGRLRLHEPQGDHPGPVSDDGDLAGGAVAQADVPSEFEERWTGGYIFENEWQSFRTKQTESWS